MCGVLPLPAGGRGGGSPVKPDPEALRGPACPLPVEDDRIGLPHGAGTGATADLFERILAPAFDNPTLAARHDGAVLSFPGGRLAFTTDSFVVDPLFFPGGDIGSLAVYGTVNDLAVCGARPAALSCALILEEGLPVATLRRVVDSMASAARACGVSIVTGDTKVVERGRGHGLYVNTAGIGWIRSGVELGPARVSPGDAVLVSGDPGRHAVAVLSRREGLGFECELESDAAPVHELAEGLLAAVPATRCLRDPTRGGLGAVLLEVAAAAQVSIRLEEPRIPIHPTVGAACDLLGLDPLFLASEGRLVAFVPAESVDRALEALARHPAGHGAACIGQVEPGPPKVSLRGALGGERLLVRPVADPLPRIC